MSPARGSIIAVTVTGTRIFLVTEYGEPFTAAGFGAWFRTRCDEAGLLDCSAHGLRKAGAVRAAENGTTPHELMAIFGWLSLKEAPAQRRDVSRPASHRRA